MQVGNPSISISPEHDPVSDEVEQIVARGVDRQILLQERIVAEVRIDVRDVGRLLCLVGAVVDQRGGARLEERP